jgi:hypothetical protein
MRAEISYDLVMADDMRFVEGIFRLPGGEWQVITVSRREVTEPVVQQGSWDSGVTGIHIRFPKHGILNAEVVEGLLSKELGVKEWVRVRGPDSMQLR